MSTYDYKWTEVEIGNTIDAEFEFGSGLSYTTFDYSNLSVPSIVQWNDRITVTLNIRNNGTRQGDHTVLLYVSDVYRSVTPPNKELKGYTKLSLQAGEQKEVQFSLGRIDLSFIGIDLSRQTEAGLFTVAVGPLKSNFTLGAADQPVSSTPILPSKSSYQQYSMSSFLVFFIATKYM